MPPAWGLLFMGTLHALLIGTGLLVIAVAVMVTRRLAMPAVVAISLLLAFATSGASAVHATEGHAGSGHLVSRGFPKPFHFHWRATEDAPVTRRDINFVFYAANTFVHFGAITLLASTVARPPRVQMTRMATGMLILRLTLGIVFLILAVIGGLVPILQGWIFFLLAILVLFPKAKFTEKILVKAETKVPRVAAFLRRMGIGTHER